MPWESETVTFTGEQANEFDATYPTDQAEYIEEHTDYDDVDVEGYVYRIDDGIVTVEVDIRV